MDEIDQAVNRFRGRRPVAADAIQAIADLDAPYGPDDGMTIMVGAMTLHRLGRKAVPAVVSALEQDQIHNVYAAIGFLKTIGDPYLRPIFERFASNSSYHVANLAKSAVEDLAHAGRMAGVPRSQIPMTNDPCFLVRLTHFEGQYGL